jgi:hypothetical protein
MDPLLFGAILAGVIVTSEPNSAGREAAVYSLRAGYYQGEYHKVIDPIAKEIDRRYIPNELRNLGIGASFVYRLIQDNRVEYSWSF